MRSPSKFSSEIFTILQLVVPLGGIQLAETAISFINTMMMGLLGIESLAAGALGAITFYTLTFICIGILEGASPLAAEAFGSGETDRIPRFLAQGFWLILFLSLPMMFLIWHLDSILMLFGQPESTIILARTYLRAIVWSFPAAIGFSILTEIATVLNRPQLISAIALTCIPLEIFTNYVLIFGKLGFPALGLAGIGWASTFVFWVTFLAAALTLIFHPSFKEYKLLSALKFDPELCAELWHNGWPVGLEYASTFFLFTLIALLSSYMGTSMLAANEIVVETIELSLIVPIAISYAAMTRVGQMIGENDFMGVKIIGYVVMSIGVVIMSLMAIILWFFPEQIVNLYLNSNESDNISAISAAVPLLKIATVFLIAYGLNLIAIGLLMGIQDTRLPLLANILIHWCFGIGSGYLLCFSANMGSQGLWLGLTIGTGIATVFLVYRFYNSLAEMIESREDEEKLKHNQISVFQPGSESVSAHH